MKPQPIIIDTDPGDDVDDVLALAFALLRPELDVKAITTATSDTDKRARIVAKLLKVMNRADVPFAPGMNLPLRAMNAEQIATLCGPRGGYNNNHYAWAADNDDLPVAQQDAIALMKRTIEADVGEIAICCIAPPTNVAVMLRRHPDLIPKIKWIAMMGGELELNRREHNLSWDAVASSIVLNSGVPLFIGTWNVTRRFVLTTQDCARIKSLGTPLGDALSACIELWWPHKGGKPSPVMYDVAPLIWSFERRYYPTQTMPLRVETRGEHTAGYTTRGAGGAPCEVAVDMLEDEVRELYLQTICEA